MKEYDCKLQAGITQSKEFERKGLATHAINVGLKCGQQCTYCSTPAVLRLHPWFREIGVSPFDNSYAAVDPSTAERVARDAGRFRGRRGVIQMCTVTDAWAPEAQRHGLGRACLEAILAEPDWVVRILTKNTAVVQDFDIIARHRDRVMVGISLTGTPKAHAALSVIEPHASPILDRMTAMRLASRLGFRTYAMLCPLLPGISASPSQVDRLVRFSVEIGAEEIFVEPINARGPCLKLTQAALETAGMPEQAAAVGHVRRQQNWSRYVTELVRSVQQSTRRHAAIERLRFLLYPSQLSPEDQRTIRADDEGVVWLGKEA